MQRVMRVSRPRKRMGVTGGSIGGLGENPPKPPSGRQAAEEETATVSVNGEPLMVAVTDGVGAWRRVTLVHLKMWSALVRVPSEVPFRVAVDRGRVRVDLQLGGGGRCAGSTGGW